MTEAVGDVGNATRTPAPIARSALAGSPELRNTVVVKSADQRVARVLLDEGPATAASLAERLGLSPAAVRKQLDALMDRGWVRADATAPYGPTVGTARGRGRPARVFSLTPAGRDGFDQGYDDLARQVLHHLADRDGRSAVREFAAARVAGLGDRVAARIGASADAPPRPADRAKAVAEVLSEDGFAASTAPVSGGVQICQHHCPVAHAAAEFPELCEAETAAIAAAVGTHVTRLATIGAGDGVCTTLVPDPSRFPHRPVVAGYLVGSPASFPARSAHVDTLTSGRTAS